MLAPNLEALVVQLNGHQVPMLDGSVVTLNTQGAPIKTVAMKAIERFLYTIADPNIAFILLSLASLGIMMEIFNPGLIFPGVLGAICGVMAFYSLGQLPVNIAGILLIVLAFGFFIGEVLTTTFGIFTAGGVVALVMGALILFQGASPVFRVDPWLIAIVTILIASVFAFVINRALRAHRKQASTGREDLIGKRAVVKVALDPEGTVFFKGERWAAVSNEELIELGEEVTITGIDGLTLQVIRKQ